MSRRGLRCGSGRYPAFVVLVALQPRSGDMTHLRWVPLAHGNAVG